MLCNNPIDLIFGILIHRTTMYNVISEELYNQVLNVIKQYPVFKQFLQVFDLPFQSFAFMDVVILVIGTK